MKRLLVLACAVMFAFVFAGTAAADAKITFKKGDEVYVCGCGAGCRLPDHVQKSRQMWMRKRHGQNNNRQSSKG